MKLPLKLSSIHYILVLSFLVYMIPHLICSHPLSPDEVDYQYASGLFSRTGRMTFKSEGDAIFGQDGFIPRHFSYNRTGEVVPHGSPGFIIFLGLLRFFLPDFIVILINPLLMVACLYLVYRISRIILNQEKKSVYAALLFAGMPLAFRGAYSIIADVLNLAIFLLAFWTILKLLKQRRTRDYVLLGIYLGSLCWVRQTSLLLFIPLGVFVLLHRKQLVNRKLALTGIIAGFIILGLIVFNMRVFGEAYAIGLTASKHVAEKECLRKTLRILRMRPGTILDHLRTLPSAFLLGFPPIVFSLLGICCGHHKEMNRKFSIFFLCLMLLLGLFFSNFGHYGDTELGIILHSSYLRYLLPAFALLPILAVIGIFELGIKTRFVFSILFSLNLIIAVLSPYGLAESMFARIYFKEASCFLLENTDEQSVIFSGYWDKSVFPQRIVFTRQPQTDEELSSLIHRISDRNYTVYYADHKHTSHMRKFLMYNYDLEILQGPELKNPVLRLIPPPRSIYPVKLYKIRSPKGKD